MRFSKSAQQGGGSFAKELARSIDEVYGTQVAFAKVAGISKPEVNQILGRAVKPETARRLSGFFESPAIRHRLREAYLDEYYPESEPEDWLYEGADPLGEIHQVVLDGRNELGLKIAAQAKAGASDPLLWLNLAERVVQIELRRGRIATALREITGIRVYAEGKQVGAWVARSFWLEGNTLRNAQRPAFPAIQSSRETCAELLGYADNEFRCIVWRDNALDVLKTIGPRNAKRSNILSGLAFAWKSVQSSVEAAENENLVKMGLQVRARVEIAQGYFTKAEDTLDELAGFSMQDSSADIPVKMLLTRMRLCVARGDFEEALDLAWRASELSTTLGDYHHAISAENFIVDIQTALMHQKQGEPPSVFIPA